MQRSPRSRRDPDGARDPCSDHRTAGRGDVPPSSSAPRPGRASRTRDRPGEYALDISTPAKRTAIAAIVDRWIDGCARAGYRAIEPDNLDTDTRWPTRLTESDALADARLHGLAIAQKNAADLGTNGKQRAGFDFAIAEECQVFDECTAYAVYRAQWGVAKN